MNAATFASDLAEMTTTMERLGAMRTSIDGYRWADATKLPYGYAAMYQSFIQYGHDNGLLS